MRFSSVFLFLIVGLILPCGGQNIHRSDVAALGMGNAYVASGFDFNAFLYNPALLARQEKAFQLELVIAQLSFTKNLFRTRDFLLEHQEDFINFEDDARSSDENARKRAEGLRREVEEKYLDKPTDISINPGIFMSFGHFAVAAYTDISYGYVIDFEGVYVDSAQHYKPPSSRTRAEQDVAVILGYGDRILPGLFFGVNLKYFRRRIVQRRLNALVLDEIITVARESLGEARFSDRLGIDFGLAYDIANRFTIALVFNDINTTEKFSGFEPSDVRLGISLIPIDELRLTFDVYDVFDKTGEIRLREAIYFDDLKKIRAGAQLDMLKSSRIFVPLRIGYDGDSPTGGIGLTLNRGGKAGFDLDYAISNNMRINELQHFFQAKFRMAL